MYGLENEYRFLRRLGSGAEGEVWLAEDLRRDRLFVSWKLLRGGDPWLPDEFRKLRAISHPLISPVLESGSLAGTSPDRSTTAGASGDRWFTSPYFPGQSLDQLPAPIDPTLLEGICHQACRAIAALNDHGLRHGDLKPAHFLWSGPHPLRLRLIDLGHASPLDAPVIERAGTPPYAAPELWDEGSQPTRNSDLYALAMSALEVIRGGPVLQSASLAQWREWHRTGDRQQALEQPGVEVSRRLLDAIHACLSPDPADRPRDAAALAHRLEPWPDLAEEKSELGSETAPLVGRDAWMRRASKAILDRESAVAAMILTGPRGAGKSRLLRALAARVSLQGGVAVESTGGEPVHDRIFSSLALRAPHRALFVDDVREEDFSAVLEGWRRIRAVPRSPAPQMILALADNVPLSAAQELQEALLGTAGPITIERVPGLDLPAFRELAHQLQRAAEVSVEAETQDLSAIDDPTEGATGGTDVDERWREGGGLPGTLLPRAPRGSADFEQAERALGSLLAGWLSVIPTSVPWAVLTEASGVPSTELWRRIADGGPHAPLVVGTQESRRVLPWAVPRDLDKSEDLDPLRRAWQNADGKTGAWASLYLTALAGEPIAPQEWRRAVTEARHREDDAAVRALAEIAPDPTEGRWLTYEARSRAGEADRVREKLPSTPEGLTAEQCRIATLIIERTDGPEKTIPFALARIQLSEGTERDAARVVAARLSQHAGLGDECAALLADPIDIDALPARSLLDLGTLLFRRGELAQAESILTLTLERSRGTEQPMVVAGALSGLSGLARQSGDFPRAAHRIECAIRYSRFAGIEAKRPVLYVNQGGIFHSLRNSDRALASYQRAAQLLAASPDGYLAASTQLGLGTVLRDRGDLFSALRALRRAIRHARAFSAGPVLVAALGNLGDIELLLGAPILSAKHRAEHLALAEKIGNPAMIRPARIALAAARLACGDLHEAEELLEASEISGRPGGPRVDAWGHSVRAELEAIGPESDRALRSAAKALRDALRSGRSYTAAASIRLIARLVAKEGSEAMRTRARKILRRGLDLARLDPAPALSRIPLEIELLRLETPSPRTQERAERLAREALQLGLVEEFFCAIDATQSSLPVDLAEAASERHSRLARRYGKRGIRVLEKRRNLQLSHGATVTPVIDAAVAIPTDPNPRRREELQTLPEQIDVLRAETAATAVKVLVQPVRAWRTIESSGEWPAAFQPPDDPLATHSWTTDVAWFLWIGIAGDPPAALLLQGVGETPPTPQIHRTELGAAIAVHFFRGEAEKEKQRVRKLREEMRTLRVKNAREREDLATRVLTQRLVAAEDPMLAASNLPWVASSSAMKDLTEQVKRWAVSDLPILLWGESGTGKSSLLHRLAQSVEGPFITENCAALPEPLLERELFGSVPGAFTGSDEVHAGLFERASGGTLVLDHLDELPTPLQAKLLRVLDQGSFRPLGSEEEQRADFRLAVTMRENAEELIERGALRPELYYRLQGIEVFVPPLRDRQGDIEPLLELYLKLSAQAQARPIPTIHPEALRRLIAAPWPGNVRELVNATQRWLIDARNMIEPEDTPSPNESTKIPAAAAPSVGWDGEDWKSATARFHRQLLEEALKRHEGNQTHTAQALGMSRRHLQNLLVKLGFRDEPEPTEESGT